MPLMQLLLLFYEYTGADVAVPAFELSPRALAVTGTTAFAVPVASSVDVAVPVATVPGADKLLPIARS